MVEVVILKNRRGPGTTYKAGSRISLPKAKAEHAVSQGWAKYVEKQPTKPAKTVETATDKTAEARQTTETRKTSTKRTYKRKNSK